MRIYRHTKFGFYLSSVSLVFAVITCTYGCGASQSQKSTDVAENTELSKKRVPIPTDLMLLMPKDCYGAVYVNMRTLRSNRTLADQLQQVDRELNSPQKRMAEYLFQNADAAAVCMANPTGPKGERPSNFAVVLRGNFDAAKLDSLAKELATKGNIPGVKPAPDNNANEQNGYKRLFVSGQANGLVLDEHTLLVASRDLTSKVLDAAEGKEASRFVETALYRKLNPYAGFGQCAFCGAVALPAKIKDRAAGRSSPGGLFRKYSEAIRGITSTALRIDFKSTVDVGLVIETASAEHASLLADAVWGIIAIGKLAFNDPSFSAVASQTTVTTEGALVRLQASATEQQAARIVALFDEKASAAEPETSSEPPAQSETQAQPPAQAKPETQKQPPAKPETQKQPPAQAKPQAQVQAQPQTQAQPLKQPSQQPQPQAQVQQKSQPQTQVPQQPQNSNASAVATAGPATTASVSAVASR